MVIPPATCPDTCLACHLHDTFHLPPPTLYMAPCTCHHTPAPGQVAEYLEQYHAWRPAGQASYLAPPSWAHLFGPPAPREMFW